LKIIFSSEHQNNSTLIRRRIAIKKWGFCFVQKVLLKNLAVENYPNPCVIGGLTRVVDLLNWNNDVNK
jgi:hypothetical protein